MVTDANLATVRQALAYVNRTHNYQLEFKKIKCKGRNVVFTLRTRSGIPGSRNSAPGRRGPWASWHAYGYIMDRIFEIEPDSFIESCNKKYKAGFTWEDKNVGSYYNPVMLSELSNH